MDGISARISLFDNMTGPAMQMVNSLDNLINGFNKIQVTGESLGDSMPFDGVRQDIELSTEACDGMQQKVDISTVAAERMNSVFDMIENNIRKNGDEQEKFNRHVQRGGSLADQLSGKIGKIAGMLGVAFGAKAAVDFFKGSVDLTNQQIQAEQQLANVLANQGANEADFLSLKREAAAVQGNTMYSSASMVGAAGELATYIKDADALKSMMGTVANYAAGMSGGVEVSYQQMVEYATQLGKALDGTYDGLKKKGFELSEAQKQIIENGTDMEKALVIDEVINQSWAGLAEQMAQTPQGLKTAMANTFDDIRSRVGARLLSPIMTLFTTIQSHLPQIEQMLNGIVPAVEAIINGIGGIIDAAFGVYQFFNNNWPMIEPVIWGIVGAFVAWKMITLALTIQQTILNATLFANPLVWIIALIVAVIVVIARWVQSVGGLQVAWQIAMNGILTAWDWLKIGFVTGVYYVLDLWDKMSLGMATADVAITNYMGDMKTNVLLTLQNMVNDAIAIINGFLGVLNKIPGVNIQVIEQVTFGARASLENEARKQALENDLTAYRNEITAAISERAGKLDDMKTDARAATADRLAGIEEAKIAAQEKAENKQVATASDFVQSGFGGAGQINGIADDTADIAGNVRKTVDFGEENLKYLRDIAERDAVNRFTTAEIRIEQHNENHIGSDMDLNGIVDYLAEGAREAMLEIAEGTHL